MDCKEFKNIVADLFDKNVDPQIKAECEEHISQCTECREYYEDLFTTAEVLRPKHSPVNKNNALLSTEESLQSKNFQFRKIAAIFVGVMLLSGIALAAIQVIRFVNNPEVFSPSPSKDMQLVYHHSMPIDTLDTDTIPTEVVRYNEATLEQILTDMAGYYTLRLNWQNNEAKTVRLFYVWDKSQTVIESVEMLNMFERIHLELTDSVLTVDLQTNKSHQ